MVNSKKGLAVNKQANIYSSEAFTLLRALHNLYSVKDPLLKVTFITFQLSFTLVMCFSTRGLESESDLRCIGVCSKGITSGLFWCKITFRFLRVSAKPFTWSTWLQLHPYLKTASPDYLQAASDKASFSKPLLQLLAVLGTGLHSCNTGVQLLLRAMLHADALKHFSQKQSYCANMVWIS